MPTEAFPHDPEDVLPPAAAQEYLTTLEMLSHELGRAMSAIASKELSVLEDSVKRQLVHCARLVEIPARSNSPGRSKAEVVGSVDTQLAVRIDVATRTLVLLNNRYSALLKHSGDTVRLFAGLFRSYSDHPEQGSGSLSNMHTWSCEL